MLRLVAAALTAALAAAGHPDPSAASSITAASISDATPNGADDMAPSLVAWAEILLDRAPISRPTKSTVSTATTSATRPRTCGHRKAGRRLERARIHDFSTGFEVLCEIRR
jgi:hypothetical protein